MQSWSFGGALSSIWWSAGHAGLSYKVRYTTRIPWSRGKGFCRSNSVPRQTFRGHLSNVCCMLHVDSRPSSHRVYSLLLACPGCCGQSSSTVLGIVVPRHAVLFTFGFFQHYLTLDGVFCFCPPTCLMPRYKCVYLYLYLYLYMYIWCACVAVLDEVLAQEHKIDGKLVDVKRAVPKSEAPGPSSR